jgi:ketosteroid isomerase-like protein
MTPVQEDPVTTAREDIAKAYKAFEQAFYKGDADTISRMYTEDAELLIPEVPIVTGRDAISQVWANIVGSGGNTVRVDIRQVEESGDWEYELGTFEVRTPAGNVLNAGKYIVIWKRQSTGERKIHRDIFNWDIAPVPVGQKGVHRFG